jgi:hypothetical protein
MIVAGTGLIYILWCLEEESWRRIGLEAGYIALTVGLAILGFAFWSVPLAAGLVAHGFWDLAHLAPFGGHGTRHVPRWYIFACLSYDWLVGAFVVGATLG